MRQTLSISILSPLLILLALTTIPLPSTPIPLGSNNSSSHPSYFSTNATTTEEGANLGPTCQKSIVQSAFESSDCQEIHRHVPAAAADPASYAAPTRDVETRLRGLFAEGSDSVYLLDDFAWFTNKGTTLTDKLVGGLGFVFRGGLAGYLRYLWLLFGKRGYATTVYDARAREAAEGLSKADFFDKYGFVILDAKTAMTAADWEASDRDIDATLQEYIKRHEDGGEEKYERRLDDFRNADTPVKNIYAKETEELIRSILPRATRIMAPARGIRRKVSGGGLNKSPASLIHNDYGLKFDEVVDRNPFFDFAKQRLIYEETNSDEYMLVNLWRPIAPMSLEEPLRSMPLCFLDASTLRREDFVSIDTQSLGVATQLKENPNHRFYYYPDMRADEVVLFKQFHQFRNESIARMPVFHTAFADPAADKTTEDRISFEYRVGLLV